jgi:predicted RND superfamily exporter protein
VKRWLDELFNQLLRWPVRRPVVTLMVAALIVALSIASAWRLQPASSLQSMMNDREPSAIAMDRILSNFATVDKLLLVARLRDGDRKLLAAFGRRVEHAITNDPQLSSWVSEIRYVRGALTGDRAFYEEQIIPTGLFYLDDRQLSDLLRRLTRESMQEQIQRNEELIATPGPAADALSRVLQKDPLRLREFLIETMANRLGVSFAIHDELLLSEDQQSILMVITARRSATDLDFTKKFLERLQHVAEIANVDELKLEYSGAYAIAAASESAIRRDMIRSVLAAVILMQVMFLIVHRRPWVFMVAFLPTAVAIVVAFGLHAVFREHVTPATAVVGAIIAGLGIDYSIHMISHYSQARQSGATPPEAAERSARELLAPTVAAAGTTFIGVFAIAQSSVGALRDFSIIALVGLIGAMVAAFTILSALLVLADRLTVGKAATSHQFETRFTLVGFTSLIDHHARRLPLAAAAIWIVAIGFVMVQEDVVPIESDLTAMHPQPNPALELQERISREFDVSANTLLLHVKADSPEALTIASHQIANALQDEHMRSAGVRGVLGLSTLLPDPRVVLARSDLISAIDVNKVLTDFRSVIDNSMFSRAAFADFERFLTRFLGESTPPDLTTLRRYERLAAMVLPRVDAPDAFQAISMIQLERPLADRAMRDQTISIIRAALSDIPSATLTGLTVISHDMERSIASDLGRLSVIAAAAVIVFLALFVRNPLHLLLALTPTALGLTFVLAGFHVFGDGLNMINLVGVPLLMGVGDNFGIFVIDALRKQPRYRLTSRELASHLAASARAITLTSMTAILGFGSLMFTSTPAIQSLGRLTALGVLASLAGTFFIVMPLTFLIARRMEHRSIS